MVNPVTEGAKIFRQIFSEDMMGFLALVALTCVLVPIFFDVSAIANWLNALSWFVVAVFVAEYTLALSEALMSVIEQPTRVRNAGDNTTLLVAIGDL